MDGFDDVNCCLGFGKGDDCLIVRSTYVIPFHTASKRLELAFSFFVELNLFNEIGDMMIRLVNKYEYYCNTNFLFRLLAVLKRQTTCSLFAGSLNSCA